MGAMQAIDTRRAHALVHTGPSPHGEYRPTGMRVIYPYSIDILEVGEGVARVLGAAIAAAARPERDVRGRLGLQVDAVVVEHVLASLSSALDVRGPLFAVLNVNSGLPATVGYGYRDGFSAVELEALRNHSHVERLLQQNRGASPPAPPPPAAVGSRSGRARKARATARRMASDDAGRRAPVQWIDVRERAGAWARAVLSPRDAPSSLRPILHGPRAQSLRDLAPAALDPVGVVDWHLAVRGQDGLPSLSRALQAPGESADCLVDAWIGSHAPVFWQDLTAGPVSRGPSAGGEGARVVDGGVSRMAALFQAAGAEKRVHPRAQRTVANMLAAMVEGAMDQVISPATAPVSSGARAAALEGAGVRYSLYSVGGPRARGTDPRPLGPLKAGLMAAAGPGQATTFTQVEATDAVLAATHSALRHYALPRLGTLPEAPTAPTLINVTLEQTIDALALVQAMAASEGAAQVANAGPLHVPILLVAPELGATTVDRFFRAKAVRGVVVAVWPPADHHRGQAGTGSAAGPPLAATLLECGGALARPSPEDATSAAIVLAAGQLVRRAWAARVPRWLPWAEGPVLPPQPFSLSPPPPHPCRLPASSRTTSSRHGPRVGRGRTGRGPLGNLRSPLPARPQPSPLCSKPRRHGRSSPPPWTRTLRRWPCFCAACRPCPSPH